MDEKKGVGDLFDYVFDEENRPIYGYIKTVTEYGYVVEWSDGEETFEPYAPARRQRWGGW